MKSVKAKINSLPSILFLSAILIGTSTETAKASAEKQLLVDAIKTYSSISSQEDIKSRLRKQETTIRKVDEILELHAATDIGLKILLEGDFGNFNIENVRNKYLQELISFNLKTCESSPSFSCLGFVSLDNGMKACQNPTQFSNLLNSSNNFKNAYRIFRSQGDAKRYELGVLSGYRNCADNAGSDFGKDYMNSRLIQVLLDNKDEKKAVGITQNMKTPLFKLLSAADIRISQGKYDYKTYGKILSKAESLSNPVNRASAIYTVTNKLYETGLDPFSRGAKRSGVTVSLPGQMTLGNAACSDKSEYLSELAMDFIFHSMNGAELIGGTPKQMLGNNSLNTATQVAGKCSQYVVEPIKYFLGVDPQIAANIRNFQSERGNDTRLNTDFFVNSISRDVIFDYINTRQEAASQASSRMKEIGVTEQMDYMNRQMQQTMSGMPSMMRNMIPKTSRNQMNISSKTMNKRPNALYPFSSEYGQHALYKLYVDAGDVCNASKSFFQKMRGGKYESASVSYFISSPNIEIDKKYKCGDEDLDLLLN
tara:strand:- start:2753 stop:4366 length:1614 start_codon:yes stop_codon:yes gene_type:complete